MKVGLPGPVVSDQFIAVIADLVLLFVSIWEKNQPDLVLGPQTQG